MSKKKGYQLIVEQALINKSVEITKEIKEQIDAIIERLDGKKLKTKSSYLKIMAQRGWFGSETHSYQEIASEVGVAETTVKRNEGEMLLHLFKIGLISIEITNTEKVVEALKKCDKNRGHKKIDKKETVQLYFDLKGEKKTPKEIAEKFNSEISSIRGIICNFLFKVEKKLES